MSFPMIDLRVSMGYYFKEINHTKGVGGNGSILCHRKHKHGLDSPV